MEDRNFMKFETQTNNRVVDYQKNFGKDLCTYARAQSKNVQMRVNMHIKMCANTFMPHVHMLLHGTLQNLSW